MNILYKPVKIEAAEQAEALPHGSVLMTTLTINLDPTEFIDATAFKAGDVWWSDGKVIATSDLIGWTALVPIEAKEEWGVVLDAEGSVDLLRDEDEARAWAYSVEAHPSRRLVTPWEEA